MNARADITLCLCHGDKEGCVGTGRGPRGLGSVPRVRAMPSKVFRKTRVSQPLVQALALRPVLSMVARRELGVPAP